MPWTFYPITREMIEVNKSDEFRFVVKGVPGVQTRYWTYMSLPGFTVDWGDGNIEIFSETSLNPTHSYNTDSEYTVTISKVKPNVSIMFQNIPELLEILTPFPNGLYPSPGGFGTFYNNVNLRSVCDNLYIHIENLTSLYQEFYRCESLKSVPAKLFAKCDLVQTLQYVFRESGLETIPDGLFDDCISATNFNGAFEKIETYPATLSPLSNIPSGLLDNCREVIDVQWMFSNSSITRIPDEFLRHNPMIQSMGGMFYGCKKLEYIPSDFLNSIPHTSAINMNSTFYTGGETSALRGRAPTWWETYLNAQAPGCFGADIWIDNYAQIPQSWGGPRIYVPGEMTSGLNQYVVDPYTNYIYRIIKNYSQGTWDPNQYKGIDIPTDIANGYLEFRRT